MTCQRILCILASVFPDTCACVRILLLLVPPDHCFVVDGSDVSGTSASLEMRPMCTLTHRGSGRALDIFGTQPGIQVYTANWLSEDSADAPHIQVGFAVHTCTEEYVPVSVHANAICMPSHRLRYRISWLRTVTMC